ncbi:MAG: glycosyltransferase family 4 protein [Chloroflexota bacterium]
MRIMMLPQFYPPIIGGEERFAHDLSMSLARRGHDVSVVTLWQPGMSDFEQEGTVKIYRVHGFTQNIRWIYSDLDRRLATPYPDPGVVRRLEQIVAFEKPEIIHGHNWMIYSCFPLKERSGAGLVWTLNDHSLVCAKKKLIHYTGENCSGPGLERCLRCASDHYGVVKGVPTTLANFVMHETSRRVVDRFLPVSNSVAESCGLVGAHLPFEVAPNFVPDDAAEPRPVDPALLAQLPEGDFMLFVGAFGHYKGVDVLLDAYRKLDNPPPLVLIGYETNEYPVSTTDLPPNVRILKNWNHDAVMAAWQRAIIGLVPSIWAEPFGIVALEGLATATPVIASRIGGLTDIVDDGETGYLVTPGDSDALSQAMRRLIDQQELRQQMGQLGRERVLRFQEKTVIPQYERIYAEVLAQRQMIAAHDS